METISHPILISKKCSVAVFFFWCEKQFLTREKKSGYFSSFADDKKIARAKNLENPKTVCLWNFSANHTRASQIHSRGKYQKNTPLKRYSCQRKIWKQWLFNILPKDITFGWESSCFSRLATLENFRFGEGKLHFK